MHWEDLPRVNHNEDAVREYERTESQALGRWIKRAAFVLVPLAALIAWFLFHK